MSTSNFQPTNQATEKEALRARLEKSLEVGGKPADAQTVSRILNAKPVSTAKYGPLATSRPFSLLR